MSRISLAFRCFFNILFHGALSPEVLTSLNLTRREAAPAKAAAPKPAAALPAAKTSDGALQILGILQRDSRLVDFLMEDIAAYADDQIGAAVREHPRPVPRLHRPLRHPAARHRRRGRHLRQSARPPTRTSSSSSATCRPSRPPGGTLRHKGWRAAKVDLPALAAKQDAAIIAPAEIEIE